MIFIPGNTPSSKNSRVWTGKFFIASKLVARYRKNTAPVWEANKSAFQSMTAGMPKPLRIKFKFIRDSRRKFDLINPLQTIQDEMVHHGWIPDDNADELIPVLEPHTIDKENPGCIISI